MFRDKRYWKWGVLVAAALVLIFFLSKTFITGHVLGDEAVPIPEMSEKAKSYYKSGNILWIAIEALPLALFALLAFSGLSAKIRDFAHGKDKKHKRGWLREVAIYVVLFWLILFVVELPLVYYSDYIRPHAYGLSEQTFGKWLIDTCLSYVITLVAGTIIVLVVYYLMKKSPKRWWLYSSLLTLPAIVFSILITPLWIEPLFNHFGPMKDKALEAQILRLADRAGIQGSRVYEVDKSEDTSTVNAYVTGFGSTKRIVLWDTIIAKLTPDELLFVMGHEMGHYVLHHIEKLILYEFALYFFLFLFLSAVVPYLITKYKKRCHIKDIQDIASFPLVLIMASLFLLATDPISNAFSRHLEHEADRFGLELTQNNRAAALAFVKLQQENLANPNPGEIYILWRSTHPPLGERITFCNTYKPWKEGKPLKYAKYIKPSATEGG